MPTVQENSGKERLSFFVNRELSDKITEISKRTKLTVSEIARKALEYFIEKLEKERIEKELEEGYKANYTYYLREQEERKNANKS